MSAITVNGIALEKFLKIGQFSDEQKEMINEIREKTFPKPKIYKVKQEYDEKPSYPTTFSKGQILELNLEKDRQRMRQEIEAKVKSEGPTLKNLALGLLSLGEWKTPVELINEINAMLPKESHYSTKSISAWLATMINRKFSICKFLERIRKGKSFHYRLVPSCVKLRLFDLSELAKKFPSFTAHDAISKVPDLIDEIRMGNTIMPFKIKTHAAKPDVDENDQDSEKVQVEQINEKEQSTDPRETRNPIPLDILSKLIDRQLTGTEQGKDIKVSISFNFEPIRVLFGFEK